MWKKFGDMGLLGVTVPGNRSGTLQRLNPAMMLF